LIYELAALSPPFKASNHLALATKIRAGVFERIPARYSDELQKLIRSMIQVEQARRPDIGQVLAHPRIAARLQADRAREQRALQEEKAREERRRSGQLQSTASAAAAAAAAASAAAAGGVASPCPSCAHSQASLAHAQRQFREEASSLSKRAEDVSRRESALAKREDELARRENALAERERKQRERERELDRRDMQQLKSATLIGAGGTAAIGGGGVIGSNLPQYRGLPLQQLNLNVQPTTQQSAFAKLDR